jgi:light-regulated signal transduction histidine kinase (bacteriophytochrome)
LIRLRERTAQLEAANKEMEAFSYSVSHDLRAPLQVIGGFSQVLLEDYQDRLDEDGKRYLSRIHSGTQRMGNLIDDLLKLSRTSRSELMLSDCDLSSLCSRVAGDLADLKAERSVELFIQPGMLVQADRHLMQVVLENLLGNAWKFTSKREDPRIEVGETVSPQGERVFSVRDNGAGFDMAHAYKLFNAFQRLHAPTEFEGTGIGLAIVQRIIHRHGGRIWAEAEPGEGATFFFTIPERVE